MMKYTCIVEGKERPIEADNLVSLGWQLRRTPKTAEIKLRIQLPITLTAFVSRQDDGGPERVTLVDGQGTQKVFLRQSEEHQEDGLGVSCDPKGRKVPVVTINLKFRDINDPRTDRGLVWVKPGDPALATLTVYRDPSDKRNEVLTEIIAAAEREVEEKILSHFAH